MPSPGFLGVLLSFLKRIWVSIYIMYIILSHYYIDSKKSGFYRIEGIYLRRESVLDSRRPLYLALSSSKMAEQQINIHTIWRSCIFVQAFLDPDFDVKLLRAPKLYGSNVISFSELAGGGEVTSSWRRSVEGNPVSRLIGRPLVIGKYFINSSWYQRIFLHLRDLPLKFNFQEGFSFFQIPFGSACQLCRKLTRPADAAINGLSKVYYSM